MTLTNADIDYIENELRATTVGYINPKWKVPPTGTHWYNALKRLDVGRTAPVPVPVLPYATAIPLRLVEATGSIYVVSTLDDLLAKAKIIDPGSRIYLRGDSTTPYGAGSKLNYPIKTLGTITAPVHIEAYPGDKPVIACQLVPSGGATRYRGLIIDKNNYPTDKRFDQGGSIPGGNVGMYIECPIIEVDQCEVRYQTMSGLFGMGAKVDVWNSWLHDNGTTHDDHGIYWGNAGTDGVIANNIIEKSACFGVQIQYSSSGVFVVNNTIVYNGLKEAGSGLVEVAPATDIVYANNIVAFNGEVGFKSYDAGVGARKSNLVFGNPQGADFGGFLSIEDELYVDPMFLNTAYNLKIGSPAIGHGDVAYMPRFDRNGLERTTPTLGALAV